MFDVSAQNGIVGGYGVQMNISGIDLTRFCTALMERHDLKKDLKDDLN